MWYHALTLPYAPLLSEDVAAPPTLPPALKMSVLLDGRVVAQTDDGALSLSAVPRWVPLSAADDASVDAGGLLVWCSYDAAIIAQVGAYLLVVQV